MSTPPKHQEYAYLDLLKDILENGKKRDDRTGTGTLSVFGRQLRFDISEVVPLLTTKFVPWKACIKELLWFLRGDTDASILKEQGVHIWDGNSSRDFLDRRGLDDLPEGDIGATYGFQWRHFGGMYKTCKDEYDENVGFDQVKYILSELKNNPTSRRIFMSAWNPLWMDRMSLPPCHVSCQFYVDFEGDEKHLSCQMYMRSTDVCLGLPFNIFSYAVLTYVFAKLTCMKPKDLVISTGDTHVYLDHIDAFATQLEREPYAFPKLVIDDGVLNKALEEITIDDFNLIDYKYHPTIKGKMSV
jgi:thymidylate synthase